MAVISRVTVWSDGQTLTASALNGEFNSIINDYNGGITNANVASGAAISYSKLALTGAILNADLASGISAAKITGTAAVLSGNTFTGQNVFVGTTNTLTSYSPSGGGTATLDLSLGNLFTVNVPAGNITIALSNAATGKVFMIRFVNDSSVRTLTWFTTIKWDSGTAITLSGSNKIDTVGFVVTGSNTYDGHIVGQGGA